MKLRNISKDDAKVLPHTGASFAVAPGELSPELDELVANELLALPSVWARPDVKPKKKSGGEK